MIQMNLYYGKVISNNDVDKKGKVQVKVLPEMEDIADNHCPWLQPFFDVGSSTSFDLAIPGENSFVWVLSSDENFQTNSFYFGKASIEGFFNFETVKNKISNTGLSFGDYPDIDFKYYKSGNVLFTNRTTGTTAIIHKKGSFIGFDSEGKIISKSSNGESFIEISDDSIKINGSNIYAKGDITVEAGSSLDVGMTASCTPSLGGVGGFLGIPNCLFTGAPIRGNKITN